VNQGNREDSSPKRKYTVPLIVKMVPEYAALRLRLHCNCNCQEKVDEVIFEMLLELKHIRARPRQDA
jgi:hypothetical protein